MSKLYIPNSVALRNFDALFKGNDFLFNNGKVEINFHPNYVALHPVGLAFYAALSDLLRIKGCKFKGKINYSMRSIPYLQRMGLFKALGFRNPVKTEEHEETGRFIPLTKISNSQQLDVFIKNIDPILHTNRENSFAIKHVFSEILRNVIEHSRAEFGGNVCATYNRKKKKISIGISDAGIGLFNSLIVNHKVTDDQDAIVKALTPGISGATSRLGGNAENAGAGLFFTKCIAASTRNHFLIFSGNSYFKLKITPKNKVIAFNPNPMDDYCSFRKSLPYFNGTLVGIDINIEDNKAFNNLIDNIGQAYTQGVKRSQKTYYKKINFS